MEDVNDELSLITTTSAIQQQNKLLAEEMPSNSSSSLCTDPGLIMWDLWWATLHWDRFTQNISVSPVKSHSTNCSTFINHPIITIYGLDTKGY
jgi:hypothetical protein